MQDSVLRTVRKAKGFTLKDVAERTGVTEGQISRIERGGPMSLKTAQKIAGLLQLPLETVVAPQEAA